MIEPETARHWRCPYFGIEFYLSHITWIFTSNTEWGTPDAHRSRLTIIRIDGIQPHDVQTITRQLAAGRLNELRPPRVVEQRRQTRGYDRRLDGRDFPYSRLRDATKKPAHARQRCRGDGAEHPRASRPSRSA